jgi:hypothetical protein
MQWGKRNFSFFFRSTTTKEKAPRKNKNLTMKKKTALG